METPAPSVIHEAVAAGVFVKPRGDRRGGRGPGTPNRITANLRADVIEAYAKVGGVEYLMRVAEEDPRTFCAILMRVLPVEVRAELGSDLAAAIAEARARLQAPPQ